VLSNALMHSNLCNTKTMVISDTTTSEQSADDNFFDASEEYVESSCKAATSSVDESCRSTFSSASKVSFAQAIVTEEWGTMKTEKTSSKPQLSKPKKIHVGAIAKKKAFWMGKGLALKRQPKKDMYY
jgi:hypothetical protein